MQLSSNSIPERPPQRPNRPARARVRADAAGPQVSAEGLIACFTVIFGGLGATAALGGLRLADLVICGLVMVGTVMLAVRDSRYLSVAVMGTWMFTPMIRRVVDWESGGYTSVTALSLLPMMATSAMVIPLLPRIRSLSRHLIEPLALLCIPVMVASGVGIARYGPSALVEAAEWLLPLLFLPYLATRPMDKAARFWLLRSAVVLAGVAALYGLYQFFILPTWDRMWLVESGMFVSMGRPIPLEIRTWGPLNSCGTAAAVWAMAIVTAFADRGWRPAFRFPVISLLLVALCLTFVRMGWIMAVAGMSTQVFLSGRRGRLSLALSAVLIGATLWLALPFIPQGEKVLDRLLTFSDLENDVSYKSRRASTADLFEQIIDKPLGIGLGYKTASKVAGQTVDMVSVDNGYGDLCITLGWIGAAAYGYGMILLFVRIWPSRKGRDDTQRAWQVDLGAIACACIATLAITTFAAFAMVAILAVWISCCVGLASSPADPQVLASAR